MPGKHILLIFNSYQFLVLSEGGPLQNEWRALYNPVSHISHIKRAPYEFGALHHCELLTEN